MKITSVDLYQVTSGKPSVAGTYWKASICRINTDEGISGFGEAGEIGRASCRERV